MNLSNAHEYLLPLHIQTFVVFLFIIALRFAQHLIKVDAILLITLQEALHALKPIQQDLVTDRLVHQLHKSVTVLVRKFLKVWHFIYWHQAPHCTYSHSSLDFIISQLHVVALGLAADQIVSVQAVVDVFTGEIRLLVVVHQEQ